MCFHRSWRLSAGTAVVDAGVAVDRLAACIAGNAALVTALSELLAEKQTRGHECYCFRRQLEIQEKKFM